jgi:hypothetical protein
MVARDRPGEDLAFSSAKRGRMEAERFTSRKELMNRLRPGRTAASCVVSSSGIRRTVSRLRKRLATCLGDSAATSAARTVNFDRRRLSPLFQFDQRSPPGQAPGLGRDQRWPEGCKAAAHFGPFSALYGTELHQTLMYKLR